MTAAADPQGIRKEERSRSQPFEHPQVGLPGDGTVLHAPHLEHLAAELTDNIGSISAVRGHRCTRMRMAAEALVVERRTRPAGAVQQLGVKPQAKVATATHGKMVAVAEHEEGILSGPEVDMHCFARWGLILARRQRRQTFQALNREEKRLTSAVERCGYAGLAPLRAEGAKDVVAVVLDG